MKVRVKKTGEVFLAADYAEIAVETYDSMGEIRTYSLDEVELLPDEPQEAEMPVIDWEHRRYEIAKDALSAHLASEEFVFRRNDYKEVAKQAICFADELINQLKGGRYE